MGVKVGGVETQESYRRLDLRINGSGFRDAFRCCWEKGTDYTAKYANATGKVFNFNLISVKILNAI